MTAEQMTLVADPVSAWTPTVGTARHVGPATSRAAAASLDPATMHVELRRVHDIIAAAGSHGATAGEVTEQLRASGLRRERGSIARRITDLRQGGLVRDSGEVRRLPRKGARDEIVWLAATMPPTVADGEPGRGAGCSPRPAPEGGAS